MGFLFRCRHSRQVYSLSLLASHDGPLTHTLYEARSGRDFGCEGYHFTARKYDLTVLVKKRPPQRGMMCPHEVEGFIAFVDHALAQFEKRSIAFQNHGAFEKKWCSGRNHRKLHRDPLGAIFFDLVAPRKQRDLSVLPKLPAFVLSREVSRDREQFLPPAFIEI